MKEITEYRQNLKYQILAEAEKSFREKGIRLVKMDDISRQLKISKRTIYELYSNKEELLLEMLRYSYAEREKRLKAFVEQSQNVMSVLLEVLRMQLANSVDINPQFYCDIRKYPFAEEFLMQKNMESQKKSAAFYQRGIEEGYFLPTIDYKVFSDVTARVFETIKLSVLSNELTYRQLLKNYVFVVLRGICTQKGLVEIDHFIENS